MHTNEPASVLSVARMDSMVTQTNTNTYVLVAICG